MGEMQVIWLVVIIATAVLEFATAGLVSIWFSCGGVIALLLSFLGVDEAVQIVAFVLVSLISMLAVRPIARKYLNPKIQKTNVDDVIGRQGIVVEPINNLLGKGQVKVGGITWTARSSDNSIIEENAIVVVEKVSGVKAIVHREEKYP